MRRIILFYCFILFPWFTFAQTANQTGTGLDCTNAFYSTDNLFCSDNAQYNNSNPVQNGITWFRFKAILPVITATISGQGPGGTLLDPTATIYSDCGLTPVSSISSITDNIRTIHAEGLDPDIYYYIAVQGSNKGTFRLCLNIYLPTNINGPDCESGRPVFSNAEIKVSGNTGAGPNAHEADGSCLENFEKNTTWFKWQAANSDPLVFTLVPDVQTNDINFVLYDLGTSGSCALTPANAKRCAAGTGVGCRPPLPQYYKTGLSVTGTNLNEAAGCKAGQTGILQSLNMIDGHYYGLLVDNASGNLGFTLKFEDAVTNVPGTVKFAGPKVDFVITPANCKADGIYDFYSYLTVTNAFTWDFGTDATIIDADALNRFRVSFKTPGKHTVKLTLVGSGQTGTQELDIPSTTVSLAPTPKIDKTVYCTGDTITLSTPQAAGVTYTWTNPVGFTAAGATVVVPVTDKYIPGTVFTVTSNTVTANNVICPGLSATTTPNVVLSPVAAFSALPSANAVLEVPAKVAFTNSSTGANSYLWDFGDGATSTNENPVHDYIKGGKYHVKLTALNAVGCQNAAIEGDFILKYKNSIMLFNSFTPNGDDINDKFKVAITNINTFHIQVFNRYGKMIFETRDPSINWDGTSNGSPVPVGVYYYIIDAIGLDGNAIKESGNVSLIR